jgi:hypothetical protein
MEPEQVVFQGQQPTAGGESSSSSQQVPSRHKTQRIPGGRGSSQAGSSGRSAHNSKLAAHNSKLQVEHGYIRTGK